MHSPAILAGIFNHVNSSLTTPQRYETHWIPFTNDANAAGAHPTLPTYAPPRPSARCLFLMGSSALLPPSPPRGATAVGGLTTDFHRLPIGNCPRRQDIAPTSLTTSAIPRFVPWVLVHPSGSMHRPRRRCSHHGGSAPPSLKKKERGRHAWRPRSSPSSTLRHSHLTSTSPWAAGYPCPSPKDSPSCSANSCQTSVLSSSP